MADIKQLEQKINNFTLQKENIQKKIDIYQIQIDKLKEQQEKIQEQINKIKGVQEDSDAAITTTTVGNISSVDGYGNYSQKLGKPLMRKNKVYNYLDKIFK